ncbi:MAG: exopolysaccharide biosynthesis protein [Pseudomonadota bacterium]
MSQADNATAPSKRAQRDDLNTPRSAFEKIDAVLSGAAENSQTQMSLGSLSEALEERAFGLLLLAFALPCCLPFVYIIPQVVALPMLALAGQMALGKPTPWFPHTLRSRELDVETMRGVVARGRKWFGWAELFARPRLAWLSGPKATRIVGMLLLIPCASILLPIPSTNTVPGIGVAIASIGLIERDGILIVGGLILGLLWVAILLLSAPLLAVWLMGVLGS